MGIEFVKVLSLNDLVLGTTIECCSPRAEEFINELNEVTYEMVNTFKRNKENKNANLNELVRRNNVVKALFMVEKYNFVEAAVDLLIIFLFQKIGFYDDRMFAFPQLPHKISFGSVQKDAIPDFTIVDIYYHFLRLL